MSATATVETLTAEVRVLMVGNRQVTLSVARQLDEVDFVELSPFGRIRSTREYTSAVEVIGKHRESGALARATVSQPMWLTESPAVFNHWAFHAQLNLLRGSRVKVREHEGRALQWEPSRHDCECPPFKTPRPGTVEEDRIWCWLAEEHRYRWSTGEFCELGLLRAEWESEADIDLRLFIAAQGAYDEAAALPLIVLAGLR